MLLTPSVNYIVINPGGVNNQVSDFYTKLPNGQIFANAMAAA